MIHSVVGAAERCGPCALSSLSGLPASTWEDRPMGLGEFALIADAADAVRLPHSDFALGRVLGAFGNRALSECEEGRYDGAWLLLLGENHTRSPVSLSSLRPYADGCVAVGCRRCLALGCSECGRW